MDWSKLIQTIVTGLADGGIYAVLALALVLIHRATGVINFAQGEMAMFSTYIALWLISDPEGWQLSFWIGFAITLAISFAGGTLIYGAIIRPAGEVGPDHDRHRHHRAAHHPQRAAALDLDARSRSTSSARSRSTR